jgi:hypothetical protein
MSSFESTRSQFKQIHFEVLEIDLPVITGACTIGFEQGYGTPLTCDQAWSGEYKTYYFTNINAPVLPISAQRCIKSISETPTELKPGQGLSSRASWSITMVDFIGDPNADFLGAGNSVIEQGTYFGKLKSRQIIDNKSARLKLYRVEDDGTIDLSGGAETKNITALSLEKNSDGSYTFKFKDILFSANKDNKQWPKATGGFIRLDVNNSVTAIPVDGEVDYSSAEIVRVNSEFMRVNSVSGNLTGSAVLNVATRGADITATVSGELLTQNAAEDQTAGDEVFICEVSDNETIDNLLERVLIDSDVDATRIPSADWAAEILEWHPLDLVNTIHYEAEDVEDVLKRILNGYLLDMWVDPISFEIKLSAISVWKQSTATLIEGREIGSNKLKERVNDNLRASRALVLYGKKFLSGNDEVGNYAKGSTFEDSAIVSEQFYKEHKDKRFDNNFVIDKDSADLLVQRYVSRFKNEPKDYTFPTEERFLTFSTGQVVNLVSPDIQDFNGLPSTDARAQITKIKTNYKDTGRTYTVSAITYEAALLSGSEIVLNSPLVGVNLFILAGAPSTDVTLTFILDGSYSSGAEAIRAGGFTAGSKLIIILANGFDCQASGGVGGKGQSIIKNSGFPLNPTSPAQDGGDGGVVYNAEGIDTDIYFSGATPSVNFPTADGYIRAPSGGDGGHNHTTSGPLYISGNGGNGGDGRAPGDGGEEGDQSGNEAESGINGTNGQINGTGGGWGNDGIDNDALKGLKGSGIIDNGATVVLFGDTPTRYINGAGDHP